MLCRLVIRRGHGTEWDDNFVEQHKVLYTRRGCLFRSQLWGGTPVWVGAGYQLHGNVCSGPRIRAQSSVNPICGIQFDGESDPVYFWGWVFTLFESHA